ncbi:hypothetical protein K474DRAFT_1713445 [Panus rudis PR-1116 ss-1]|nr:hypothetical protein K474DRAFT_1713445 [Panus rudis PR-1116 ss-1]
MNLDSIDPRSMATTEELTTINATPPIGPSAAPFLLPASTATPVTNGGHQALVPLNNRPDLEAAPTVTATPSRTQSPPLTGRRKTPKRPRKVDVDLTRVVQRTMVGLLGFSRFRRTDFKNFVAILSHPVARGEAPSRLDEEGKRIWTPDFTAKVTTATNTLYIEDVVKTVLMNETAARTLRPGVEVNATVIEMAAKQYFSTLRDWYGYQNDPAKKAKRIRKGKSGCHGQRRARKADVRRRAIPKFRAKYGDENTVGIEQLIETDYQSSDASDCGNATEESFNEHRKANGGGTQGLETRRLEWRSDWFNRLLYALDHIGGRGAVQRVKFRGMKINSDPKPPPFEANERPYISCVSETWATRTQNEHIPMQEDPEEFTIFKLEIPDNALDAEDLAWLADDEEDAVGMEE